MIKAKWCGLQVTKSQQGRKYDAMFIYAYVTKAETLGRVMMRKVATIRKSKTHNRQWKTVSSPGSKCALRRDKNQTISFPGSKCLLRGDIWCLHLQTICTHYLKDVHLHSNFYPLASNVWYFLQVFIIHPLWTLRM